MNHARDSLKTLRVVFLFSFGIDVHIGRETADYIDRYFVGNRFPTAEESICGAEEYYREFKKELDRRVVEWYSAKAGSATNGTDLVCIPCRNASKFMTVSCKLVVLEIKQ